LTRNYSIWDKGSDDVLRQLWEQKHLTMDDMLKVFVEKTPASLLARARTLGLPNYGERFKPKIDYEYLKRLGITVEG